MKEEIKNYQGKIIKMIKNQNNNKYFVLPIFLILLGVFLISCNGVTPSTDPPTINSFTANSYNIISGESITLSWNVTGADSVTISQGIGTVDSIGTKVVNPTASITYTLTATNTTNSVTSTVTINGGIIQDPDSYSVTFNSQGGSAVAPQMVEYGEKVTKPADPSKEGYTFGGWYKESGWTNAWDFANDTVTANVTLYAKWTPYYTLRDTGPAGGLIFYVKEGGYSDGWMYLEAAPASTEWTDKKWGSPATLIGGTETGIGSGQSNTNDIVALLSPGYAAGLCDALDYGGYSDWFLPSKDELNLMYLNLKVFAVGGFSDTGAWWSSSERDTSTAWSQIFYSGYQLKSSPKNSTRQVRAVRAF